MMGIIEKKIGSSLITTILEILTLEPLTLVSLEAQTTTPYSGQGRIV